MRNEMLCHSCGRPMKHSPENGSFACLKCVSAPSRNDRLSQDFQQISDEFKLIGGGEYSIARSNMAIAQALLEVARAISESKKI